MSKKLESKVSFFDGLPDKDQKLIQSYLKLKAFNKGELLFREGQSCERIFIVQTGRIKLYRLSTSGKEQILEILNDGDTCACHPGNKDWFCATSAEAVIPSKVWFLSRDHFSNLLKSKPSLSQSLNRIFAERLQCFSLLIDNVTLKDSKERLIQFLLDMQVSELSDKKGSELILIPFTREEIARRLGTTRETVTRNLSHLKKLGLIEIKPKQILIKDRSGMKELLRHS